MFKVQIKLYMVEIINVWTLSVEVLNYEDPYTNTIIALVNPMID